ncbi:MAG: hypothetical protein ACTSYI_17200 [Promethearchaeota archaeon]
MNIIQTVVDVEEDCSDEKEGFHTKFQDAQEIELSRMIKSLFGLTKSQVACFIRLRSMGKDGTCVQNLVAQSSSERSVEQKKLKRLLDQGLVTRVQLKLAAFEKRCSKRNRDDLSPGTTKGYLYIYSAISDEEILDKVTTKMENWQNFMGNLIQQQP